MSFTRNKTKHVLSRNVDYDTLLSEHSFPSLTTRRNLSFAHFGWKIIHNKIDCPPLLSKINFHVPRLNSRHSYTFEIPTPCTNILWKCPLINICRQTDIKYSDVFFNSY